VQQKDGPGLSKIDKNLEQVVDRAALSNYPLITIELTRSDNARGSRGFSQKKLWTDFFKKCSALLWSVSHGAPAPPVRESRESEAPSMETRWGLLLNLRSLYF
jgi:hypothetical protein